MGTRNDDISLILAKAKKQGFLPDVKDEEVDILRAESKDLFGTDSGFINSFSKRVFAGGFGALKEPWPAVHPSPPVITHAAALTSTGTRQTIAAVDSRLRRYGDYGSFDATNGGKTAVSNTVAGISLSVQNSTYVEFTWYGSVANAVKVYILLDGKPVTLKPVATAMDTGTGTRVFTHILLPDTGRHTVEFIGGELGGIGNVYTQPNASVSPTPAKLRLGYLGDSFGDGTSHSHELVSHPFIIARILDMELPSNCVGGTGYKEGVQNWGSVGRLDRMARSKPDIIVFDGSVNDGPTLTVAEVTAVYDAYAKQHPGIPFIVFGPQPSSASSTLLQDRATVNKTVRDAANAHPSVIAFFDMIGTADGVIPPAWSGAVTTYKKGDKVTYLGSVWAATSTKGATTTAPGTIDWELLSDGFYGTGQVGTVVGDGTRDILLASDGVHPTEAGSDALANSRVVHILNAIRGLS